MILFILPRLGDFFVLCCSSQKALKSCHKYETNNEEEEKKMYKRYKSLIKEKKGLIKLKWTIA